MNKQPIKQSGMAFGWIAVLVLIVDQISKYWVAGSMQVYQLIEVTSFFNITYVHNPGAAFSFLADQSGWQRWFFTCISLAASVVFTVWLFKVKRDQKNLALALNFMLAGAVGNLLDRAILGYVIDFLDFYWEGYHWPAFNIADSSIFIGAVIMIIDSLQQPQNDGSVASSRK